MVLPSAGDRSAVTTMINTSLFSHKKDQSSQDAAIATTLKKRLKQREIFRIAGKAKDKQNELFGYLCSSSFFLLFKTTLIYCTTCLFYFFIFFG